PSPAKKAPRRAPFRSTMAVSYGSLIISKSSAGAPASSLGILTLAQMRQTFIALAHEPGQFVLERTRSASATTTAGRPTGSGGRIRIVHLANGKTDLAVAHVEHLDFYDIIGLQVLVDVVHIRVSDLRNVHQAGLSLSQLDEGAEDRKSV